MLIASFVKQHEAIIGKTFHKFGGGAKFGREHSSANVMTFLLQFFQSFVIIVDIVGITA